jgi:hypothetical protein
MLRFDCGGRCEGRASRVDVDSVKLTEDEDGVSASSCGCSNRSKRTDSEGGGKMNVGVFVSPLRINRGSESGTMDVGGCGWGLLEKGEERGTPDNSTVWARMSFCE